MNYYQACQRKDGGWHFTVKNDDSIWPVGYCAAHPPHPTQEEAESCYAGFLLDQRLRLPDPRPVKAGDHMRACKECGELTPLCADIDGTRLPLCDIHRTRPYVEKHWDPPTQICSSW